MPGSRVAERFETVVIGGGQAGLAVGYHLARRGLPFVIFDAHARVGDSWRGRCVRLRLFTPAHYDGLPGMPFPATAHAFPTKDEMADYLESYAARFELPVRTGIMVDRLSKQGGQFVLTAGDRDFEAQNVVVAMSNWQRPRIPSFAQDLDPGIVQLHSSAYRHPAQLRDGGVLVVGAANSGAEIALEVAHQQRVWLSGRDTGAVPFRIDSRVAQLFLVPVVLRVLFHRVLTIDTPIGRKLRPKLLSHGMPLLRVRRQDLASAGVERVPRVVAVRQGRPVLEDERALDVANVIWCTGFEPGFSWIDLPIFGSGELMHHRGIVASEPGLHFVGLTFLYAASSSMIHGVGRDAEYAAKSIASVSRAGQREPNVRSSRAKLLQRVIRAGV